MNPAILAAATASHAWAQQSPAWAGTPVSGAGFFWLGLFNVIMLMAFLAIVAQRRDHRADGRRGVGAGRSGSMPSAVEQAGEARPEAAGPAGSPATVSSGQGLASARPAAHLQPVPAEAAQVTAAAPPIRASDAERDETAATLSRAIGVGCLGVEEGVGRIDAAYHARHRHELTALLSDLSEELRRPPARRTGRFYRDLRDFAALALVAAVLSQTLAGAWEMWPVAAAALLPFAFRRHAAQGDDRSART